MARICRIDASSRYDRHVGEFRFRDAGIDDCRLIFEWANDPETRANSAATEPIEWDGHVEWFERKLVDPNAEIWIVESGEGLPLGQVRFDLRGDEAEIGVMVAAEHRGGGLGTQVIERATRELITQHPGLAVIAHVRHHNVASQRAFVKAGYEPDGEGDARGVTMLRFVRRSRKGDSR